MNNLVSIIVPIWNVEPFLRRGLDSILSQTYPYLEVILVDDGSPDNCGAICDEYAEKDKRVRVIHQCNHGISVARQVGLDAATGDYVIHFDPDDYVEPDVIECLVAEAKRTSADMVTCNFFNNDGKEIDRDYKDPNQLLKMMLQQKIEFSMWNVLISRKHIVEHHISFTPTWLCHNEDHLFIIRCLVAGAIPTHLNKAFYHYITRGDSLVTTRSKKAFNSILAYIHELEKLVKAKDYDDLFRLKRYVYIYAYESRYWKEMNHLFPEIRFRLLEGGNSERYSIDSQLARCMKYPPCIVWLQAKIHKYAKKLIGL